MAANNYVLKTKLKSRLINLQGAGCPRRAIKIHPT
jgi:hypothetical protein